MKKAIDYKQSSITYYSFGYGSNVLFCFHGYGQSGKNFAFLENELGLHYTLLCLDLPYHGDTIWNESQPISAKALFDILQTINPTPKEKFSILAYSMGGRIALQLIQNHADEIKHAVLIAPDGLELNRVQQFATQTQLGNWLFVRTMKNPYWFFKVIDGLEAIRFINKKIAKFAIHHINTKQKRKELYSRWMALKAFMPNGRIVNRKLAEYGFSLHIIIGKFDKLITSKHAKRFKNGKQQVVIHTFNDGHELLKEKFSTDISKLFNGI